MALLATLLEDGERVVHEVRPGRHAWIHVARGSADVGGERLAAGDAASTSDAGPVELVGRGSAEVLVFDLA